MSKNILVTGGAGYIGSHTVVALIEAGYSVTIADSFDNANKLVLKRLAKITGQEIPFVEVNLCNEQAVNKLFAENSFDSVMHFAGKKAVGESVEQPLVYYKNNLLSTINLAVAMQSHGVFELIFSSSATVYGNPSSVPITEDVSLQATNPYGHTKLMCEQILRDVANANPKWRISLLRYFNPVGAHHSGLIGEDPAGIPNNLLPFIAQVAVGKRNEVTVFGSDYETPDGTGVRDYIHVVDLAKGHLAALEHLPDQGTVVYNLGTGRGYSVLEMITAFREASGKEIPYKVGPRRPGDIAICYADPSKAERELDWKAEKSLQQMCADAWHWQQQNPNGYIEK